MIALLASIGACLTAIASFMVLLQNYRQRQASYRPEIVIKNICFETSENQESFPPDEWISQDFKPQNASFALPIVNIGLGSAKQIKAEWIFDFQSYISKINESAQASLIPARLKYVNESLVFESDEKLSAYHSWKIQKIQKIDYILPISVNDNPVALKFPPAIILAMALDCCFCMWKDVKKSALFFPNFPKIELQLCYYDIGNKKHIDRFEIKLDLFQITRVKDMNCSMKGFIESKKTN